MPRLIVEHEPSAGRGVAPAAPPSGRNEWLSAGMDVLRQQVWLIAILLGYIALGMTIGRWHGQVIELNLYGKAMTWLYMGFALIAVAARAVGVLRRHRPARPISFLMADFKAFYLAPGRILAALPVLVLMGLFISVVSSIKRLIPIIQPFRWDRSFAEIDRVLHGGVQPWELLQPLLGHPFVTRLISEFYGYPWLIAVAAMQFWLVFTGHPERQRLLMTNLLAWILLGGAAAMFFSSAGPVYYGHFVAGADPYADLLAYLASVQQSAPIASMDTQAYLWSMYEARAIGPGVGISAMPSMHLSMATLMVLSARRLDRRLTAVALVYLVFLQIGSVHLGWHYAIDGYAGIAGTLAIWWALGRLVPAPRTGGQDTAQRQGAGQIGK